jgi:hypothetical protein
MQVCIGRLCNIEQKMISMNVTDTTCDRPRRDNTFLTTICASFVGSLTVLAVVLPTVEAWIGNHGLDPPQFRLLPVYYTIGREQFYRIA